MRWITRRAGTDEFKHPIFDSYDEFKTHYPDIEPLMWYNKDIRKDNWVLTDDSRVMKCLKIVAKVNPVTKEITKGYYFFPNGTYCVYPHHRIPALYADYMKPIVEPDKRKYYFTDDEVKIIVKLIVTGHTILDSCFIAKPKSKKKTIKFLLTDLAENPKFKEYMKAELTEFNNALEERFSDEMLLGHIEDLLSHSRKGTQSHRENIMFVMALRGMIRNSDNKNKIANATEVPYESEQPPV